MPLSSQHQVPRRSSFAGKHEHAERWNDPPSAAAAMARVERKEDAEKVISLLALRIQKLPTLPQEGAEKRTKHHFARTLPRRLLALLVQKYKY